MAENKPAIIELKSNSFKAGETIPQKYTCDGDNVSPSLSWGKLPDGTKELTLICDDPDAPHKTWTHWVLYGLSPDTAALPENLSKSAVVMGARQGKNDSGNMGYDGPCPPKGPGHRYFFRLLALDKPLDLQAGAKKADVLTAAAGHILGQGELMGRYGR